jgi:hypothetical protein
MKDKLFSSVLMTENIGSTANGIVVQYMYKLCIGVCILDEGTYIHV